MDTHNPLEDLNDKESSIYVLPIGYVCVVMTCGIIGNGIVLLVYKAKMRKSSNYRLFVLTLACLDVVASLGMPGLIVDMLVPFMFYNSVACKLLRYGYHVISCASSMVHLLIGVERYRRICGPLQTQMSLRTASVALAFIFLLALTVSVPALFIYGTYTFIIQGSNITAFQCHIDNKYIHTSYPLGYDITLLVLLILTVLSLAICYVQIGRRLLKASFVVSPGQKEDRQINELNSEFNMNQRGEHGTNKMTFERTIDTAREFVSESYVVRNVEIRGQKFENDVNSEHHNSVNFEKQKQLFRGRSTTHNDHRFEDGSVNTIHQSTSKYSTRLKKTITVRQLSVERSQKITAITFVLTLVFTLSFLPFLMCVIVDAVNHDIRDGMTNLQEAWYQIGQMSYIISSASNPFVYYMMDKDFRVNSQKLICRPCLTLRKKPTLLVP